MKKFISICLVFILSISVYSQSASANNVRVVPKPTGKWKLVMSQKYSTINTSNAKLFAAGAGAYYAGKLEKVPGVKKIPAAAVISGLIMVWSSKIENKTAYMKARVYQKKNSYVTMTNFKYDLYSDEKMKKKIKSYTKKFDVVLKYKTVTLSKAQNMKKNNELYFDRY